MKAWILLVFCSFFAFSCQDAGNGDKSAGESETTENSKVMDKQNNDFDIVPIEHTTAVFTWNEQVFYIDPVGGEEAFEGQPRPDVVLITDIHGDHFNEETLRDVVGESTQIYAPQAVKGKMSDDALKSQVRQMANGEERNYEGIEITAIPMYNLREEALEFHPKGRGNGYLLEHDGLRVYFSGDTEDIPEVRALEDIDKAFVCMNLPYTMPVEAAADAVLEFKPKEVYPFHFRGKEGFSDVEEFKRIVNNGDSGIEVKILDWYPE